MIKKSSGSTLEDLSADHRKEAEVLRSQLAEGEASVREGPRCGPATGRPSTSLNSGIRVTPERNNDGRSQDEQADQTQPVVRAKDLSAQVARWESEGGRRGTPRFIGRIVVGVDGSEHASAAVLWVANLAQVIGAEVFAVFASIPPDINFSFTGVPVPRFDLDPKWLNEMMRIVADDWCEPLKAAGVAHQPLVEGGRPAAVIAAVADRVDAELVVVGRRGRGGLTEMILGSVSHELLHHSRRAVLLISELPAKGALA